MENQKRALLINDLSGYGRCALSVALPALSACGVETSALPTAILSTHLGFPKPVFLDMSSHIPDIAAHWQSLNIGFDAIATGFMASAEQIRLVSEVIDQFNSTDTLVMVDPTMGDNGKFYSSPAFNDHFLAEMVSLCKKARLVTPNITEACMMAGIEYQTGPYNRCYTDRLLERLSALTGADIVLTGVYFEQETIGCGVLHKKSGNIHYNFSPRANGAYIGTGDLFGAVLLGFLLQGRDIYDSAQAASDFISYCIGHSNRINTDNTIGVNFEQCLGELISMLGKGE